MSVFQNVVFYPRGIVFGPDGHIYVSVMNLSNKSGGHVLRFNPDGSIGDKGVFITDEGGFGRLNRPEGLVFGPDRNLYITSFQNNTTDTDSIQIYDGKKGYFLRKIELYKIGQDRAYAQAIIFGPNGRLFVPIYYPANNTGEVRQYNVDYGTAKYGTYDSFIMPGGKLINPWYLTFGKTDPKTLEYRS